MLCLVMAESLTSFHFMAGTYMIRARLCLPIGMRYSDFG
jgi:hypothetical protein